jgi:ABC-type Na+ efflux pump permease subunit
VVPVKILNSNINPRKIWEISKKDLFRILKGKSFLYVLIAQFIVISLTITSFTQFPQIFSKAKIPSNILRVGFVGGDYKFYTELETMNITLYPYSNLTDAIHGYNLGYIDAIILCRKFSSQQDNNEPILVKVFIDEEEKNSKYSLLISRLKDVLERKAEEIKEVRIKKMQKLKSNFKILRSLDLENLPRNSGKIPSTIIYSLLLPLFFLSAVTLSGTLMINLLLIEIERKTIENLLSSPLSKLDLILGKSFTSIILAPLQIFLWIGMLNYGGFPIQHTVMLLALAFFYALIFTSLALISAIIPKTRDTAQNIYTIFLIPTFTFLLPIPLELIKSLGVFINIIPVFLITRLSFTAEISPEILISFFITGLIASGLFTFSLKLAEKHL